jgi:hypothetical protein
VPDLLRDEGLFKQLVFHFAVSSFLAGAKRVVFGEVVYSGEVLGFRCKKAGAHEVCAGFESFSSGSINLANVRSKKDSKDNWLNVFI